MTNISTFEELLLHLVNAGFDITLRKGADCFGYEIYTGAKSNLIISKHSTYLFNYESRYDNKGTCEDYQDFLYTLKGCLCGRDYANGVFFEFLVNEGMMKKTIETKVKYD